MFRTILKGTTAIGVTVCGGVLAACFYGTAQQGAVVSVSIAEYIGSSMDQDLRLVDVNTRLQVPVELPVPDEDLDEFITWSIGSGEELLIYRNETLDPDVVPFSDQYVRYSAEIYNVASGETRTLISYTMQNGTLARTLYPMSGNLATFWHYDPTDPRVRNWLAIYHRTLNKLFIYDEHYTLQNTLGIEINAGAGTLYIGWSPDASQLAIRYRPGILLIVNRDGSNPRFVHVPNFRDFTTRWSTDGRELLVTDYNDRELKPIHILDLETMQWRTDMQRIVGRNAYWLCHGKWLWYDTSVDDTEPNVHLLHMESGRIIHVNQHPKLDGIDGDYSLGTRDCKHWSITTDRSSDPTIPYSTTYSLYLADFDFSNLRFVDDNVMFSGLNASTIETFSYQTVYNDQLNIVYRQRYDGTGEPEVVGYIPTDVNWVLAFYDNNQRGLYTYRESNYVSNLSSGSPTMTSTLYVFDVQTGKRRALLQTNNFIASALPLYSDT